MILSKYNEVMERLTVTPEMKARILQNVAKEQKENQNTWKKMYSRYIAMAACLVLVLIGAMGIPRLLTLYDIDGRGTDPQPATTEFVQGVFAIEEKKDVQALSDAIGFSVQELGIIPYDVEQTEYLEYGEDIAEINYIGKDQTICYRKGNGTEDVSGIYETYSDTKVITVGTQNVTVCGEGDVIYLATWTDGTYAYSIYTEQGVTQEQLEDMVK